MAVRTAYTTIGFLVISVLYVSVVPSVSSTSKKDNDVILTAFKNFITQYRRNYTDINEHEIRFETFKKNWRRINDGNRVDNGAEIGINKFADWTDEEFQKLLGNHPYSTHITISAAEALKSIPVPSKTPSIFDWRKKKSEIVGPVRDQGHCGSCWAFSTVETIASAWALAGHPFVECSAQQLVSCDTLDGGCRGGSFAGACEWLVKNKVPIVPESVYPYEGKRDKCMKQSTHTAGIHLQKYGVTNYMKQESMMISTLLRYGPISVAVDATSWRDYIGGIVQHHCDGRVLNHAVQIVGYNLENAVPYWIVKNSWGDDFGINGYIYIKMNDDVCGIAENVGWIYF